VKFKTKATPGVLTYLAAILWLALTLSLATWWLIFGLQQADRLRTLGGPEAQRLEYVQRMLTWEGTFLIGLVVCGGVAIVVAIRREQLRQRAVQTFFMSFTHDLKTALASLQLQAEILREDLPAAAGNPNLDRLLMDARRLQLQLENSLYFAEPHGDLMLEPVDLQTLVTRIAADWPEMSVSVAGDGLVLADRRALESVVRNLLQNAAVHGGARSLAVRIERGAGGRVVAIVHDDGRGAPAQTLQRLGEPFVRAAATSGTGVGLHVCRQLMLRMQGDLQFGPQSAQGFTVVLQLAEVR
jgi:signal transduction histidine kinase